MTRRALSHLGDPRQEPGVARADELPGPRDREQVEEDRERAQVADR